MALRKHYLQRVQAPSGKVHAIRFSQKDRHTTLCGRDFLSETTLSPETKATCRRCLCSLAASWDLK
jgi:hypothetical protein